MPSARRDHVEAELMDAVTVACENNQISCLAEIAQNRSCKSVFLYPFLEDGNRSQKAYSAHVFHPRITKGV